MRGTQMSDFGCVRINSRQVMILGGKMNMRGLRKCEIFDLESRNWSKGPVLPIEMMFCQATLVGKYVHVLLIYFNRQTKIRSFNFFLKLLSVKKNRFHAILYQKI